MELLQMFSERLISQITSPTLAFLLVGMLVSAFRTQLQIPDVIYQFVVFMLLMRIGIDAGMDIREANIVEMLVPSIFSLTLGVAIVLLGSVTLARLPGIKRDDALGTAGLFGAVSSATMLAGMAALEEEKVQFEGWMAAASTFMDLAAPITAIVLASLYLGKIKGGAGTKFAIWPSVKEAFQGGAPTILFAGILLGLLTKPERVFDEFYDPLFRGFLSMLMFILGMQAYKHIKDLKGVGHWYAVYAFVGPIVHGLMGFGLGYIAHQLVGLSPGGVILLAIIAASNSDISGPPTIREGIPSANPAAYIGTSTGLGTPVAIVICIPLFIALGKVIFGI